MRRATVQVLCLVAIGLPASCPATGFYVPQQTAYGAGRANAGGVAMAREASTVFFNPAGMTHLERAQALFGLNVVTPYDSFRDRGTTLSSPGTGGVPIFVVGGDGGDPGSPTPVGSLFYARPVGSGFWAGIGITAPFGLRLEYAPDWFGRYDSIESRLVTIDVAPSFAYRLTESLSVGAGLDIQYAAAKLTSAVPDTLSPAGFTPATDGRSELRGDDVTLGFNAGLLWRATPSTRVGLHFRSKMVHDIEGHNKVTGLSGLLAAGNGRFDIDTKLKLPEVLSFGFAHELTGRTTLVGEVQWFGWSRFEDLQVRFANGAPTIVLPQGYRDTYAVSVGAEHLWRDDVSLRVGVQFDRTPTVDQLRNTSVPDGNRIWTALGVSYRPSRRAELTVSLQHVFFEDPEIDLDRTFFDGTPAAASVRVRGRADSRVDTVSFALRYLL